MGRIFHLVCAVVFFGTAAAIAQSPSDGVQDSGRLIYIRSCAICHGMDLKGRDANWQSDSVFIPPLDFSGKAWRLTDPQLEAILQSGSHGSPLPLSNTGMPPFAGRLDARDISAVLAYLKDQWIKPQRDYQEEATDRAALPREAVARLGAELYAVKCAVCHGAHLEGKTQKIGSPGQERSVRIPALQHNIFAQAMSDRMLRDIIIGGEAHHPIPHSEFRMPDMRVSEEQANALVLFLRQVWQGKAP